jgi:hypothetical protein
MIKPRQDGYSVPLGKPISQPNYFTTKFKKIRIFINKKIYMFSMQMRVWSAQYDFKSKFMFAFEVLINVLFSGFLIHYAINNQNILGLGIASALFLYYLERCVTIIKKPYSQLNNNK